MKALITDVSMVLLFPSDTNYKGSLNALYKEKSGLSNFKFFDTFRLNTDLLEFYKNLDANIYILTSDAIQDAPELQPYWQSTIHEIFSASKMGTHKSEPVAYEKVLQKLKLKANEVIYVDDNEDNIAAANKVGLVTILYKNNDQVIADIHKLL